MTAFWIWWTWFEGGWRASEWGKGRRWQESKKFDGSWKIERWSFSWDDDNAIVSSNGRGLGANKSSLANPFKLAMYYHLSSHNILVLPDTFQILLIYKYMYTPWYVSRYYPIIKLFQILIRYRYVYTPWYASRDYPIIKFYFFWQNH